MVRDWRKLHNEELCNLYPLPDIINTQYLKKKKKKKKKKKGKQPGFGGETKMDDRPHTRPSPGGQV
jgi:hypothetical protein